MELFVEKIFSGNLINFLCVIGLYALICWCYDNFKSVFQIILSVLTPLFQSSDNKSSLSEKYGKWAVITGSTDGIGLEYAKQLAKHGLNIVLVSRTETKLNAVAREIGKKNKHELSFSLCESKYGVKTKTIAVDFGEGREVYDQIKEQLKLLDIGILVNNVGRMYEFPDNLDKVNEDLIWQIVNINVGAVTMMSRLVIPQMKKNRRGIIVNVSSGTEAQPLPLSTVYASSKIYVKNFSLALSKELEKYNVQVQLLSPMFVKTKINNFSTSIMESSGNIFIADASSYAKWAVFTLGKSSQTTGYWSHGIQYGVTKLVPECFRTIVGYQMNKQFRREYYEQQESKN